MWRGKATRIRSSFVCVGQRPRLMSSRRTGIRAQASSTRPCWGLLADDLTGACDAAVQFAEHGFCAAVWLKELGVEGRYALVARTTRSRSDVPQMARSKVQTACRLFHDESRQLIYKKIDSTLRGNLGIEIQAT